MRTERTAATAVSEARMPLVPMAPAPEPEAMPRAVRRVVAATAARRAQTALTAVWARTVALEQVPGPVQDKAAIPPQPAAIPLRPGVMGHAVVPDVLAEAEQALTRRAVQAAIVQTGPTAATLARTVPMPLARTVPMPAA